MQAVKIGLWLNRNAAEYRWKHGQNIFQLYIEEILSHAGIPYRLFDQAEQLHAYRPDIIVNVLAGERDEDLDRLLQWAEDGAVVIAYGGLNRLAARMGCVEVGCREAVYAEIEGMEAVLQEKLLRALCSQPWKPSNKHEQSESLLAEAQGKLRLGKAGSELGAASLTFRIGSGKLIRWNVDIPSTVVFLQQGRGPVYQDGIPAEDGTGGIDEGILKADDGMEVDWKKDRILSDSNIPYFSIPYGDLWREVIVHELMKETEGLGLALPFLDYWPRGIEQVAMISHDSDFNSEEAARTTLELLKECGVRSTWCMIEPGYSRETYDMITAAGHELAFHFNALEAEGGVWSQDEFARQLQHLRQASGADIVSNKNHYTRFEGWGELFRWCEAEGIQADQTRGPSKKGNVGFPFGTAHPYYPIAWAGERNRLYDVLQIGFLTQDLQHPMLPDMSVIGPFLQAVKGVRGVAHFLFHQQHIHHIDGVREAFRAVVSQAKSLGYTFWTCAEITSWEQARRKARLSVDASGALEAGHLPEGAVIRYYQHSHADVEEESKRDRYGLPCPEWSGMIKGAAERTR